MYCLAFSIAGVPASGAWPLSGVVPTIVLFELLKAKIRVSKTNRILLGWLGQRRLPRGKTTQTKTVCKETSSYNLPDGCYGIRRRGQHNIQWWLQHQSGKPDCHSAGRASAAGDHDGQEREIDSDIGVQPSAVLLATATFAPSWIIISRSQASRPATRFT